MIGTGGVDHDQHDVGRDCGADLERRARLATVVTGEEQCEEQPTGGPANPVGRLARSVLESASARNHA
jgi:hypothetical protein